MNLNFEGSIPMKMELPENYKLSARDKVNMLQDEFLNQPQIDIGVAHYFVPGVYIREIFVPKGVMLIGKIHKYPQFHVITKGEISILIDDKMVRIKAPCNITSPAGAKRFAYAHEDTTWLMVHGTNETNVEKIERHFIAATEEEYLKFIEDETAQLKLFKDEQC